MHLSFSAEKKLLVKSKHKWKQLALLLYFLIISDIVVLEYLEVLMYNV